MQPRAESSESYLEGGEVDPTAGGAFQDKRTWENQLARHILSGN